MIASLGVALIAEGGGFRHHRSAVVSDFSDCENAGYVCDDSGVAWGGHGVYSGFGKDAGWGRRAIPAPVYFANAYPEYLYGSPNIYAGFDAYDQDIAFISPVVAKGQFHYRYWNDQYNNNPYYGREWDQNWNVVQGADSVPSSAVNVSEQTALSAGQNAALRSHVADVANAVENEDAQGEAISTDADASYSVSPPEGAYQGRFIYNFESFCDDDVCLFRPLIHAVGALFGAPFRSHCSAPVYAAYPADPFVAPCGDAICGDIYVDPCCGGFEGFGVPVYDGSASPFCCEPGDASVIYEDGAAVDSATATEGNADQDQADPNAADPKTNAAESQTVPENAEKNAENNAQDAEKIENKTPPADLSVPAIPQSDPSADEDEALQRLLDPISTQISVEKTIGCIRMTVPEDAMVVINGYRTRMTGTDRQFVAKNLVPGESYAFEIKVILERDGQILAGVKKTLLQAGQSADIVFNDRDLAVENEQTLALK